MRAETALLPVYLTVDIGPALATLGRGHEPGADWAPTMAALPLLRDAIMSLEDRLGLAIPVTWFIRADNLVRRQFGSSLAVIHQFLEAVGPSFTRSHELGWMPQLYDSSEGRHDYEALRTTHEEVLTLLPELASVRMGDCFHDNTTMGILDNLGIRFDCSAVPGRQKTDPGWHVDWRDTPTVPYHPSRQDYRRAGDPHWDILEVPMTMIPMQADYDRVPMPRYVNPCFHRRYLWPGLTHVLAGLPYLVCLLHPDELLPGMPEGHPMLGYSPKAFEDNIVEAFSSAQSQGREPRFARLRDHAPIIE